MAFLRHADDDGWYVNRVVLTNTHIINRILSQNQFLFLLIPPLTTPSMTIGRMSLLACALWRKDAGIMISRDEIRSCIFPSRCGTSPVSLAKCSRFERVLSGMMIAVQPANRRVMRSGLNSRPDFREKAIITSNLFVFTTGFIPRPDDIWVNTMILNFCTRTTRKIQRLGHAKKTARRYARFFFVSMMNLCGLFGLDIVQSGQIPAITGSGHIPTGSRAASPAPASSRIQRR